MKNFQIDKTILNVRLPHDVNSLIAPKKLFVGVMSSIVAFALKRR